MAPLAHTINTEGALWPKPIPLNETLLSSDEFEGTFVGGAVSCGILGEAKTHDENWNALGIRHGMTSSPGLLAGSINFVASENCLLTTPETQTSTNGGDSGGPIIYNGEIVGILSGVALAHERSITPKDAPKGFVQKRFATMKHAFPLLDYALSKQQSAKTALSTL